MEEHREFYWKNPSVQQVGLFLNDDLVKSLEGPPRAHLAGELARGEPGGLVVENPQRAGG